MPGTNRIPKTILILKLHKQRGLPRRADSSQAARDNLLSCKQVMQQALGL